MLQVRLQHALQEYDENFDVIGLINFNWGHTLNKPLNIDDGNFRECRVPQSKSTIINGTEDHTSVAESSIQRSGHAQSPQSCLAAMADIGRDEVVNRLWHSQHHG